MEPNTHMFLSRFVNNAVTIEKAAHDNKLWKYEYNPETKKVEEIKGWRAIGAWFGSWGSSKNELLTALKSRNYEVLSADSLQISEDELNTPITFTAIKIAKHSIPESDQRTSELFKEKLARYQTNLNEPQKKFYDALMNDKAWDQLDPLQLEDFERKISEVSSDTLPEIKQKFPKLYLNAGKLYHTFLETFGMKYLNELGQFKNIPQEVDKKELEHAKSVYIQDHIITNRLNNRFDPNERRLLASNFKEGNVIYPPELVNKLLENARAAFPEHFGEEINLAALSLDSYELKLLMSIVSPAPVHSSRKEDNPSLQQRQVFIRALQLGAEMWKFQKEADSAITANGAYAAYKSMGIHLGKRLNLSRFGEQEAIENAVRLADFYAPRLVNDVNSYGYDYLQEFVGKVLNVPSEKITPAALQKAISDIKRLAEEALSSRPETGIEREINAEFLANSGKGAGLYHKFLDTFGMKYISGTGELKKLPEGLATSELEKAKKAYTKDHIATNQVRAQLTATERRLLDINYAENALIYPPELINKILDKARAAFPEQFKEFDLSKADPDSYEMKLLMNIVHPTPIHSSQKEDRLTPDQRQRMLLAFQIGSKMGSLQQELKRAESPAHVKAIYSDMATYLGRMLNFSLLKSDAIATRQAIILAEFYAPELIDQSRAAPNAGADESQYARLKGFINAVMLPSRPKFKLEQAAIDEALNSLNKPS